jgi:hypothetical protein
MKSNNLIKYDDLIQDLYLNTTDAVSDYAKPGRKAGNKLIDINQELQKRQNKINYGLYSLISKYNNNLSFKYPKTKLIDLYEFYKSIKCEENVYFARIQAGINENKVLTHFINRINTIKKEYKDLLHKEDNYKFKNLNSLEIFLLSTNLFSRKEIKEDILHEEEHEKEIRKRGYQNYNFGCWLCLENNNPNYVLYVSLIAKTKIISIEDYKAITLAVKNPSTIDKLCKY